MKAELLLKISNITLEIETNYPELYQYLDENPLTIPDEDNLNVDDESLRNYLETLRTILKKYKEEHP
ncbi:hypothetical protein CJ739_1526 [Mariniflexile rhizosphaerae]|uniref:hypothetical protein n=1 Tax=unclassified Mariniflexile TaxID=2643887 RepID=UPI000CAD4770|nr:hypothetical protein [Mariniflexile sp. TRM1-10]AXP80615.1 hypothetical protein CJ739_1526 [Mariniflexile sp. TRM1-10]PLB20161.1 MAG: hypothetical protein TRG1_1106 [Flavobacteriaceae bacterium FS1-H7996/R]